MKKNKLYTANQWNQPTFMSKNLFPGGGSTNPFGVSLSAPTVAPYVNWGDPGQRAKALGETSFMVNNFAPNENAVSDPFDFKSAFSKEGLKNGLKAGAGAAISAGAGIVGNLAGNALSGGLQSDAGNAISNIGGTIGTAVGTVNPVLGAAVSVGSQLLGGLANRAFGSKLNQEKINEIENNFSKIGEENNSLYSVEGTRGLLDSVNSMTSFKDFNQGDIGEDGWFSSTAEDKYDELKKQQDYLRSLRSVAISTNADKVNTEQHLSQMRNLSAFGGPLDNTEMGGVIDYDFMNRYLTAKEGQNKTKNKMSGIVPMPAFMPNSYAIGGDLQTNGADWSDGLVTIGAGGSHEENPNEGVQLGVDNEGTPNLVEEGETIYNDYVFSNRILADEATKQMFRLPKKREITFADISKKLEKEIAETPNDPISKAGFEKQMQMLEEQQERQKQEMEAERAKAAFEALSPEEQQAALTLLKQREQEAAMQGVRRFDDGGDTNDVGEAPEVSANPGGYADPAYHEWWLRNRQQQLQENIDAAGYHPYPQSAERETDRQLANIAATKEGYFNEKTAPYNYDEYGNANVDARYVPGSNPEIEYEENYTKKWGARPDEVTHERTHALNRNLPYDYSPQEEKVQAILREGLKDNTISYRSEYNLRPHEVYGYLMQQRYNLGLKPDYVVTPEDINKWKHDSKVDWYFNHLDDDTVLRLFNEVAYEPMNRQDDVNYAANGGRLYGDGNKIVKKDNGQTDFETSIFDTGIGDVVIVGKKKKKKPELPTINATRNEIIEGLNYIENQNDLRDIATAIRERNGIEEVQEHPRYIPIHYYKKGGIMNARKNLIKALNLTTDDDFSNWMRQHRVDSFGTFDTDENLLEWNKDFLNAIKEESPALAHALSSGYDFGAYEPTGTGKATIQSIGKGNWKATNGRGWFGSDDLAFKQATEGLSDDEIKALTTEQLAKRMRNTQAYKSTTEWLKNKDNALQYLRTLVDDEDTPDVAKRHAWQFLEAGNDENNNPYIGWRSDYDYNYDDVFGKVRATNPGTYWHSAVEANRGNVIKNFVQDEEGNWQEIQTDIPSNWISKGSYTWDKPDNSYTYNYLSKPSVATAAAKPEESHIDLVDPERTKKASPILRKEWPRYAGLFGPAVGLGMMAAGVGKPDYGMLDAAANNAGKAHLASYKPIGNYLRYNPMDIWYEQNRVDANARATDRAIMNNAAPIGTKMAGLLASGYNNQIANGQLYRNALEYNDAKRAQVAEFNRGTDKYNADAFTRNSQFNAAAMNDAEGRNLNARLHAASERLNRDAGWYNSLYGNVAGLFRGLGDLGRENAQWNMIARGAADGVYGNLGDSYTGQKAVRYSAKGGKIKKGKRGLTY